MIKIKAINYQTCQSQDEDLTPEALSQGGGLIGRNSSCDIVLKNPEVSRVHGRITYQEGNYFFTDLGSTGGSVFNGQEVPTNQDFLLKPNDLIRVGGFILLITALKIEDADGLSITRFAQSSSNGTVTLHQTPQTDSNGTIPPRHVVLKENNRLASSQQKVQPAVELGSDLMQQPIITIEEFEAQGILVRDSSELKYQGKLLVEGISLSKHLQQKAIDIRQAEINAGKLCLLVEHPSHYTLWWEESIESGNS
ncbi:MAG: FHA domain-containing protein [Cyanobacteria bacterium J06626_18]